ncbi:MAG TPA: FmdE family protein [Methylomusa anaerophila]|uniref:FmdE, Molybdenum formylmethanofuran dehydrogenase operon n=1 Tax=Methylomusa anaerophila TaxID=1930071 RepID=A0A348AFD4_9FIRM|nr:FmdE family protein [Methylomusa anaerophila]BBB89782.1 FmdE, Molybdenum formylmethanofuran dehydrogenase operon [Methylomusa anaerophila]HML89172.1 FmdE family protein [Methylomusa anaerophila]
MITTYPYPPDFQKVVDFHGHVCPGLVTGYRLAKAALSALGMKDPAEGDLVTIAETDRCTVDAFQVVLGCTIGKGRLFIENCGKQAFTVGCRKTQKAVRVVTRAEAFQYTPEGNALTRKVMSGKASNEEYLAFKAEQGKRMEELLTLSDETILKVYPVAMVFPDRETIFNSPSCEFCGEQIMEPWVRMREGRIACIACAHD